MKKLITIGAVVLFAQSAHAEYIGIGYNRANVDYQKSDIKLSNGQTLYDVDKNDFYSQKFNGLTVFAGYEVNKNVSLEVSYTKLFTQSLNNKDTGLYWTDSGNKALSSTKVKMDIAGIDGIYTYHFNRVGLFGSAGLSCIMYEESGKMTDNGVSRLTSENSELGIGANLGIGAEFEVNKHFRIVTSGKYIKPFSDINNMVLYEVNAKYKF